MLDFLVVVAFDEEFDSPDEVLESQLIGDTKVKVIEHQLPPKADHSEKISEARLVHSALRSARGQIVVNELQ